MREQTITREEREVFDLTGAVPVVQTVAAPAAPGVELTSIEDVLAATAKRDEAQILAAAEGQLSDEWVYEFTMQGKRVEGISVTGATELARIRADLGFPIRLQVLELDEKTMKNVAGQRCIVVARDARSGCEHLATAFYPYEYQTREGQTVEDRHTDRKAMSVAQRNAILGVVPHELAVRLLRDRKQLLQENATRRRAEEAAASAERRANAPKVETTHVPATVPAPVRVPERDDYEDDGPACPKCGASMFDNRAENEKRIAAGQKPRPNFKCRDRNCDGCIWPPRER